MLEKCSVVLTEYKYKFWFFMITPCINNIQHFNYQQDVVSVMDAYCDL